MNTLIFRTMVPFLAGLMLIVSLIVLLRGHNAPGGGFIGGLLAASAVAIYGMAFGVGATRKLLRVNPLSFAGFGVLLGVVSGVASAAFGVPFLTALWLPGNLFGVPGLFDVGVYCTVSGTFVAIALALEDSGEGG